MAKSTGMRSVELLRKRGFVADMVERRNRFVSHDFLGCIDLIGAHPDGRIIGVQATSRSNRMDRVKKIVQTAEIADRIIVWLSAGCECEVWCWGQMAGSRRWVLGRDLIRMAGGVRGASAVKATGNGLVAIRDDCGFE